MVYFNLTLYLTHPPAACTQKAHLCLTRLEVGSWTVPRPSPRTNRHCGLLLERTLIVRTRKRSDRSPGYGLRVTEQHVPEIGFPERTREHVGTT
jgi:hypothetical protein